MWETASGTKNVGVRWYYHLAEVECSNASERQKLGRIKRPKVCILLFKLELGFDTIAKSFTVKRFSETNHTNICTRVFIPAISVGIYLNRFRTINLKSLYYNYILYLLMLFI